MFKNVASQKLVVFAFDATANTPKTGDSANLTAYVSKDFGTVTVLGDTSATEMDSTNAKGYYLFDLTQSETNADILTFSAKSSTSNIVVIAVPAVVFTRPANFTAQSIDSNGRVDVIKVAGTTQTARDIGASVLLSNGTGAGQVSLSSGTVTVGTNNDKTGYGLSSAAVQAIWDALTSALTTAGSIGKLLVDNINATISSRSTYAGGDTSGTTTLLSRIVGTLASGTHNPQSGDAYARLGAPAGASVSADVAAVKAVDDAVKAKTDNLPASPANETTVAAVKAKTDSLTFTVAGNVDANVQKINDVTITGDGSTTPFGV